MILSRMKLAVPGLFLVLAVLGCGSRAVPVGSETQSIGNGSYVLGLADVGNGLRSLVICDSAAVKRKDPKACIPAFTDSQGKVAQFTPAQARAATASAALLNLRGCAKQVADVACAHAIVVSLLFVPASAVAASVAPFSTAAGVFAGLVTWFGGAKILSAGAAEYERDRIKNGGHPLPDEREMWGSADRRNAALIRDVLRDSASGGTPVRSDNLRLSMERLAAVMGWRLAPNLPVNLR